MDTPIEMMSKARAAQISWGQQSASARCSVLRRLRLQIAEKRDEIVDIVCKETGKPPLDALGGDVLVTLEQLRYYEGRATDRKSTRLNSSHLGISYAVFC